MHKQRFHINVQAANGTPFRVVLTLDGKSRNFPDRQYPDGPMVEFYDTRFNFTPDGQFVARYRVETLLDQRGSVQLNLDDSNTTYKVDVVTMNTINRWLYDITTDSAALFVEQGTDVYDSELGVWAPAGWWRVVAVDAHSRGVFSSGLWCETSDEEEAREALTRCPYPCRLEQFQRRTEQRWVAVHTSTQPLLEEKV